MTTLQLAKLAIVTCLLAAGQAHAAKLALLIGVGDFQNAEVPKLQGPKHDVQAMQTVLSARWGYEPQNISTLIDSQATKPAIVQALKSLMDKSRPGDEVLIYFSGHGTSSLDPALGLPLPYGSGAFAPYGARISGNGSDVINTLLVGRTELRPLLQALDQGERKLWVIFDTCYSAQTVRSVGNSLATLPSRSLPALAVGSGNYNDYLAMRRLAEAQAQAKPAYPYRNTAFLAAAAEGEKALDIPPHLLSTFPTLDGKPHGVMTDALLRVLHGEIAADYDGDGTVNLHELQQAVGQFMAQRGYGHTPQRLPSVAEDSTNLGSRSLLSGSNVTRPATMPTLPKLVVNASALPPALQSALPNVADLQWAVSDAQFRLALDNKKITIRTTGGDLLAEYAEADRAGLAGGLQQLAWAHRMNALALQSMRGVLPAAISPELIGGNRLLGDSLHFDVRPDQNASLLLLNADSAGKVSVLYPFHARELNALPGGTSHALPSANPADRIQVQLPLGMDVQLIFAFDQPAPDLRAWVGKSNIPAGDPRLADLARVLAGAKGKFTYAKTELRVLPKP
jgi:hypothetical protein